MEKNAVTSTKLTGLCLCFSYLQNVCRAFWFTDFPSTKVSIGKEIHSADKNLLTNISLIAGQLSSGYIRVKWIYHRKANKISKNPNGIK